MSPRRLTAHVSRAIYHMLHATGTARINRRAAASVLCYHNVVPDAFAGRVGDPPLHMGKSSFAEQIDWLAHAFTIVPLGELLDRLRGDRPIGGLAALTFDDGYTGVLRHAIPVMRKAGVPFALFPVVSGAERHRPFWWDRLGKLDAVQRERHVVALQGDSNLIASDNTDSFDAPDDLLPAPWEMLREVIGNDCTIGVHTVTHRNLTTLEPAQIAWELTRARERLLEELGTVLPVVAYPYGQSNDVVRAVVERIGFTAGLCLDHKLVRPSTMWFDVGRSDVPQGIDLAAFGCWASGLRLRG